MVPLLKSIINKFAVWLPIVAVLLFVGLYVYAASIYPGGTEINPQSLGFDWQRNYWCDLMSGETYGGVQNPSCFYALSAMAIISVGLMAFFILFANRCASSVQNRRIIKICGSLAMIFAFLISTRLHSLMLLLASLFGSVGIFFVLLELFIQKRKQLFTLGIFLLFVLILNNVLYFSSTFLVSVPILQKLGFVLGLGWMALICLYMINPVQRVA
ncbi:MAG: hypothetical protein ACI83I_001730 [Bacteroidia bacterium]